MTHLNPDRLPTFGKPPAAARPASPYTGNYPAVKVILVLRRNGLGAKMTPIGVGLTDKDVEQVLAEWIKKFPELHGGSHEVHEVPLVNDAFVRPGT